MTNKITLPNTNGAIGNCFKQPGHIRNQRKALIESLHSFINISVM